MTISSTFPRPNIWSTRTNSGFALRVLSIQLGHAHHDLVFTAYGLNRSFDYTLALKSMQPGNHWYIHIYTGQKDVEHFSLDHEDEEMDAHVTEKLSAEKERVIS